MIRSFETDLDRWLTQADRKPLVLRGARQVGKTWSVRRLAERHQLRLVEVNFERRPELKKVFSLRDPQRIMGELSLVFGQMFDADHTLLFLDEIQEAGEVLADLRWFKEALPALPVIAAGSLLEFVLQEHSFSMPVGRISYGYVEPMTFPEYLEAHGQSLLLDRLRSWRPGDTLADYVRAQADAWFQRYGMIGGMPSVVAADIAGRSPRDCRELQRDLIATYRDDFSKYAGRTAREVLDATLRAVVASLGRKFVYARVGEGIKQQEAKQSFELLDRARVCTAVMHTAANGVPLGGEVNERSRKAILLDIGLVHALLGTPALAAFPRLDALAPQVRGQLAEQAAGQALRALSGLRAPPELFYWHREGGRPGGIDYLLQLDTRVIPVELKAGASGAMKSLHQFMFDKGLDLAVRIDASMPSLAELDLKTTQGNEVRYRLLSLPHYLTWNVAEIVRAVTAG